VVSTGNAWVNLDFLLVGHAWPVSPAGILEKFPSGLIYTSLCFGLCAPQPVTSAYSSKQIIISLTMAPRFVAANSFFLTQY
jgi:hypothetical protein